MSKKKTTEEFIERAVVKYGSFYDYSKISYIDAKTKIHITCPVHGGFYQIPRFHLRGYGCPKCGRVQSAKAAEKTKLTIDEFEKKAIGKHGNFYDYSKVSYINAITKVCIICSIHGEFWQTPDIHLSGKGCSLCGVERRSDGKRLTKEELIKRSISVHGEKYDYSRVEYNENNKTIEKVNIICPIHGSFLQSFTNHIIGKGCPVCKSSKGELTIREWLINNKLEFKYHYNYKDLRGLGNRLLEFDFYIPFLNLLIEFDGQQHYMPISFGVVSKERTIEGFKRTKCNDELKNQYCFKNNIPLLRIPYNKFKEIPEILSHAILGQ